MSKSDIYPNTININIPIIHAYLTLKKPATQAAGQTRPNATPPLGKIHPFSKIAVTFEPIQ